MVSFRSGAFACKSCRRRTPKGYRWNPFDVTKVWPHKDYPLIDVGVLELNRNPENYFAESRAIGLQPIEHCCPASASRQTKCCKRAFSLTPDAHRYRVGTHYEMLPVNRPKAASCERASRRRPDAL